MLAHIRKHGGENTSGQAKIDGRVQQLCQRTDRCRALERSQEWNDPVRLYTYAIKAHGATTRGPLAKSIPVVGDVNALPWAVRGTKAR